MTDHTMTLQDAYIALQEASGIKIGDTVRVLRKANNFEMGWSADWVSPCMDECVGETGVVEEYDVIYGFQVRFPGDRLWTFPFFVLEKIAHGGIMGTHFTNTSREHALVAGAMEAAADACTRHVMCKEAITAAVEYALSQQPAPPSAPVGAGVEPEPGAVRALVAAANAVLALYPHDDQLWTLESAVRPFNSTRPAECSDGCPPQQVCEYCQIANLSQQPAAVDEAVSWQQQLADALDSFWNPACGAILEASYHGPASGSDVVSAIAQGLAAVSASLREAKP